MPAISTRQKSASRIPDVDPKSPAGVALTTAVQDRLRQFLGSDYTDRSLAQYVVVMLAHKTEQGALGDNLVEFLGEVDAREVASWLFENLNVLIPPPKPEQQAQQQAQQPSGHDGGAAGQQQQQAAAGGEHDQLDLEIDGGYDGEEDAEGGSDAGAAQAALDERGRGSGGGDKPRRLQSAVVRDEYRQRDVARHGRSRSRSPRRRRSSPSPRGRRRSPLAPRRRSPPRYAGAEQFFYSGSSGARYHGHDPYPYRRPGGAGWQRRSPSPPLPFGVRGGHGHGRGSEWAEGGGSLPWSPRRGGSHPGEPRGWGWGGPPLRMQAPGGGGGIFERMQPPSGQEHWQHDVRFEWEEEEDGAVQPRQRGPAGLPAGAPLPGGGSSGQEGQAYDAGMGTEHLAHQPQQQHGAAGSGQAALPWERPSYMDLELQRQQQLQAEQAQHQAAAAPVPAAVGSVAARLGGVAADPAVAAFSRAITQAAASLGLEGRRVATVPVPGMAGGRGDGSSGSAAGQLTTFQVTITHQNGGPGSASQQSAGLAPLLSQPDLQQLLRQRLRQMELELVKLRAEQAERALEQTRRQRELTAAAKLDLTVRSICIKGVHPAASQRVLIAHFGRCGYIEQVSFLRDPISGRKTGVAYLQFSSALEAQAALALNGSSLLQRAIQVVPSDSPSARVAAARVLRASLPPPGLVALPLVGGPILPLRHGMGRNLYRSGSGGRGGRGSGRGHGTFKYVRPADLPVLGCTPLDDGGSSGRPVATAIADAEAVAMAE